jgi:hypothetical protein
MRTLAIALVFLMVASLAPVVESEARAPRQRAIGPSKMSNVPRLSRPRRVPRIRRYGPRREPRPLSDIETERLRQTEDLIRKQSLPVSICRGC